MFGILHDMFVSTYVTSKPLNDCGSYLMMFNNENTCKVIFEIAKKAGFESQKQRVNKNLIDSTKH